MNDISYKLIGAVIGVVRASENCPNVNAGTYRLIRDAVAAYGTDEYIEAEFIERLHDEKERLVPDCSTCMNPCGRTFDYEAKELVKDDEAARLKLEIVDRLRGNLTNVTDELLMRVLYYIGYTSDRELLRELYDAIE